MSELEKAPRPGPLVVSSQTKVHKAGTDKLRELEFDPLEELIGQLQEIQALIEKEKLSNYSRPRLLADLMAEKSRILQAILPYRYGKAPILTIEDSDAREPIVIRLED